MRGIALLRNARIQNANDVVNLAFGYASEEDRLELKKSLSLDCFHSHSVMMSRRRRSQSQSVAQRN